MTTTGTPGYQRLFAELKRRRVFRVAAVYGAVAFVVLQVADIMVPALASSAADPKRMSATAR